MKTIETMAQIHGWLRTARINNIDAVDLCRRIIDQLRFKRALWIINWLYARSFSIRKDNPPVNAASKILICNLDNLGDAIRITPAIRAIKQHWPHIPITVLSSEYNTAVFQNNPHINTLIVLERNPGLIKTFFLLQSLRKIKFSHSFIFCFGPGVADYCAIISALADIPIKVGLDNVTKPEMLTYHSTRTIETNHVELLKKVITSVGIEHQGENKEVFVTKAEEAEIRDLLSMHLGNWAEDDLLVVIAPGGFGHIGYTVSRVWPDKNFRQLVIKIIKSYPKAKIVITGNNRDSKIADMICTNLNTENVINLTNKLNVRQLAALLKIATLVITNDNGTLHLSDAVSSRHIICITGPTDPRLMCESGNKNIQVVQQKLSCGPCITLSAFLECTCPQGQICLSENSSEDVFIAVQKALND